MTTDTIEAGARAILDRLNAIAPAVENLASNQQQADIDGCMVTVSRQAIDEVLTAINDIAVMIVTAPSAIASGALVPASAVAEMRERAARKCDDASNEFDELLKTEVVKDAPIAVECSRIVAGALRELGAVIRQLDLTPACGDYVVVPREPTVEMQRAGLHALENRGVNHCTCDQNDVWTAMLHASSSNGGEK
jgi:hypothetical protein